MELEEKPAAWLVPHLLDFTGARAHFSRAEGCTLTDDDLKEQLAGTVVWNAEVCFLNDCDHFVVDRNGVKHRPVPLFRKASNAKVTGAGRRPVE